MMDKTADVQKLAGNDGLAEAIVQLEHDPEQKDDLARRLLDQCRYQHLVLAEIHGISADRTSTTPLHDLQAIEAKARAALSAESKSGLLA